MKTILRIPCGTVRSTRHVPRNLCLCAVLLTFVAVGVREARCDDALVRIRFTDSKDTKRDIEGKIVVTAQDGGVLLLGRDGRLWNITPNRLESREETGKTFAPMTADELSRDLLKEVEGNFKIVQTPHYVIATVADGEYAEWCGDIFESLLKSFADFWKGKKVELHEPEFPLVAIILPNRASFSEFAFRDAGEQARASHGYYSVPTNRMILYDLTADLPAPTGKRPIDIRTRLESAAYNVATVVHEATHQIAFNSGMHTRLADNPLWLTEGMAMYCETPDFKSKTGWKTIGALNKKRLSDFQNFVRQRRKGDSLKTLVSDSRRFAADPQLTGETYSEAWALTYFLIKTEPEKYAEYLRKVAAKEPLMFDKPEVRLREFQEVFAEDLAKFDQQFLNYIRKLRAR